MKRLLLIIIVAIMLMTGIAYAGDNYHRVWVATSGIGSASGSADSGIAGVSINANDRLIVISLADGVLFYRVTNTSAAENYPYVIRPDDVGIGTTSWELVDTSSGVSTVRTIVAGVSVYNLTSSQTLTKEMMGGSYIGNYGALSEVTYTMLTAWKGASCNFMLDQDQTSGSSIAVIFPTGDKIINAPNFKVGSGAGTSYYFLSGTTGADSITLIGVATGVWKVFEYGSPTQSTRY